MSTAWRRHRPPPGGPWLESNELWWLIGGIIALEFLAYSPTCTTHLLGWEQNLIRSGDAFRLTGDADPATAAASLHRIAGFLYTGSFRLAEFLWIALVWRRKLKRSWFDLGLRPHQWKWDARWAGVTCAAFGVMALFGEMAGFVAGDADLFRDLLLPAGRPDPGFLHPVYAFWHALIPCLLGPVVEELFFRGIIYRRLSELARPRVAIPAAAFIFALAHFSGGRLPLVEFVGGLAFAALYERTRSLLAPMIVHAAGNLALFGVHYLYLLDPSRTGR